MPLTWCFSHRLPTRCPPASVLWQPCPLGSERPLWQDCELLGQTQASSKVRWGPQLGTSGQADVGLGQVGILDTPSHGTTRHSTPLGGSPGLWDWAGLRGLCPTWVRSTSLTVRVGCVSRARSSEMSS